MYTMKKTLIAAIATLIALILIAPIAFRIIAKMEKTNTDTEIVYLSICNTEQ